MRLALSYASLTLPLLLAAASPAQDLRHVTEPAFPPACTVLQAKLAIVDGVPSSETAFDTGRLQSAMNSCKKGQAVELAATAGNNAFLIQPIDIPNGVTLLVDGGVTVFASRNPADYQKGTVGGKQMACGSTVPERLGPNGCRPLITVNHGDPSSGSGIMGYGVINARGNEKMIVNGKLGPSWHDQTESVYKPGTNTMTGTQNNPLILVPHQASNFTLYKITFRNAPFFHVRWEGPAQGFTAWGVKLITRATVANTDGLDPVDDMKNVTIANSYISTGDDNVAITANQPNKPVSNVTLTNLHLTGGDGISIGSGTKGGIHDVVADHIYASGILNAQAGGQAGIKVKSAPDRGNVVSNITYSNFCIRNQKLSIQFTPGDGNHSGRTDMIPTYKDIHLHNITVMPNSNGDGKAGAFQFLGYDAEHITTVSLDNVIVQGSPDLGPTHHWYKNANLTLGPGPVSESLQHLSGEGFSYSGKITEPHEAPFACSDADFPSLVGELYLSTASATNLQSVTVKANTTVTLNAVVEEVATEYPHPTMPVTFFEGAKLVGTAALSGNGTLATLTLSNLTPGTHTFTARYPRDIHYPNPADINFGLVTVTVAH